MSGVVLEPISASLDDLAVKMMSPPSPKYIAVKKPSIRPKFSRLDYAIAKAMWKADDRPCLWSDLDDEEKAEWAVMARAAKEHIKRAIK